MNFFLLVSFIVILISGIESHSYGNKLLVRLNSDIAEMNKLMLTIQQHFREERVKNPYSVKMTNYYETVEKARVTLKKALKLMESIEDKRRRRKLDESDEDDDKLSSSVEEDFDFSVPTRRSEPLQFNDNFYKALSRALKEEYKNEPVIQENINDGFVPPTKLQRRAQR